MMSALLQDLRYGLRMLVKSPGFTAVAVMTLALGIGACTAIFSVVYGVLLRPLPYPRADRMVHVFQVDARGKPGNLSDPNFQDLHDQNRTFQAMAEYSAQTATVIGGSEPVRARVAAVSHEFFDALGAKPLFGAGFRPEQLHPGGTPVLLVGYDYWKNSLGGDSDLSRHKLRLEGSVYSVVGVMPRGFDFPFRAELWMPRERWPTLPSRTALNWHVVGRLKDAASLAQSRADLSTIARRLKQELGGDTWMSDASVIPLQESLVAGVRPALLVLLGAAGVLLLAACANVANLLLAKTASRRRELSVRLALGASQFDLARQFLTETLLLSLAGGGLGVLIAVWGVDTLMALAPPQVARLGQVSVNLPILGFALGLSFLTGGSLALVTTARASSRNLLEALKSVERLPAGGKRDRALRAALVGSQVALAFLLLAGASLLGRSFLRLLQVDPGFRTSGVVAMDLFLSPAQDEAARADRVRFLIDLLTRLRRISGVRELGVASDVPLTGGVDNGQFLLVDRQEEMRSLEDYERLAKAGVRTGYSDYERVSDGYFRAMGIPLIQGRLFDASNGPDAPHVAVISESLARETWPDQDPIGKHIEFGNMDRDVRLLTIVGIVGDVRGRGLHLPPDPTVYANCWQRPQGAALSIVMEVTKNSSAIVPAARSVLRELDPQLPPGFRTLEEVVASSLGSRRFNLILLGVFSGAALLLAMMGIYGVMSYTVSERTQEVGIRIALGAAPGDVLRLIAGQGLRVVAIGTGIGMAGALAATRLLRGLVYGVSTYDPATFIGVALLLDAVALLACYLPARRATKVDPMVALRYE